jgi:hypothetical protein
LISAIEYLRIERKENKSLQEELIKMEESEELQHQRSSSEDDHDAKRSARRIQKGLKKLLRIRSSIWKPK